MTVWDTAKALSGAALASSSRSTKVILAAAALAILVTAAVPVVLVIGIILMLLGHVIAGLALFGASVMVAIAVFSIAMATGLRQLRKLMPALLGRQDGEPDPADDHRGRRVVHLDKNEYQAE